MSATTMPPFSPPPGKQRYGSFKVWTEACMYHAVVKRIALQNFLRVNQKDYAPILKGCSTDVHHRFGGHHALGGERHDRDALGRWFERLGRLAPTLQLTVHIKTFISSYT
jgi:hypothetical protein